MREKIDHKRHFALILIGGSIPVIFLLKSYLHLSQAAEVALIVVLSLIFASLALWIYATDHADGTERWQDDDASGWRGY